MQGTKDIAPWHTSHDFRESVLTRSEYSRTYASGTRMNHPGWAGYFCFYLTHGWNSRSVQNGTYRLEVAASDIRGNVGLAYFAFTSRTERRRGRRKDRPRLHLAGASA